MAKKATKDAASPKGKSPIADKKAWAKSVCARLKEQYPDAKCALEHGSPLELLVATILSAQCTDKRVNMVTPVLFGRYPTVAELADADIPELESIIKSTGFFRNKAKNIKAASGTIRDRYGGKVPDTMEELLELAGVARKTANVVLGNAYGVPGLVVDTHVGRITRRLGLTSQTDPEKVERELMELLPPSEWTNFSHRVIYHGRDTCDAKKPKCSQCIFRDDCPRVGVTKSV